MDLKMEVYTPTLELVGILEIYKSIIWAEKAFSAGSFSVESLITDETKSLLVAENIIWIEGDTAGIIEHIQEEAGENGPYVIVKGYTLTKLLDRRILWGQYDLRGTAPDIMCRLVDDCCIHPTRGDSPESRIIPNLVLLDAPGGGSSIRVQKTGGTLLEELEQLGETYGVAFGVRFNPAVPQMEFWTRWGQNRSVNQTANDPVFYSTELDDVLSSEYSYDSSNYRNVSLVAGEGEGADRVYVTVCGDGGDTPTPPIGETYIITLGVDPEGGGIASGGGAVSEGTSVTVTSTPSSSYDFVGWRENGSIVSTSRAYTFTANKDRTLTAVFAASVVMYTVSASIDPDGSGTVAGAGKYEAGAQAILKAEPADGFKFTGWQENGQIISADAEYSFTVNGNRTFTAVFAAIPASRLPEGYTEVEYIQSDSESYIQTDIQMNFINRRIVMDIEAGDRINTNEYIMAATPYDSRYFFIYRTSATTISYRYNTAAAVSKNIDIANKRILIDWDFPNNSLSVGNAKYTTNKANYGIATKIKLFSTTSIAAKLYSAQIYTSGTIEGNFVPCINPSGTVGLYDLIGAQFYANAGTGEFTAGPAI